MTTLSRRPHLSFAAAGHPFVGVPTLAKVSISAGLATWDGEIDGRLRRLGPSPLATYLNETQIDLRAAWVTWSATKIFASRNDASLIEFVRELVSVADVPVFVCDATIFHRSLGSHDRSDKLTHQLIARLPKEVRVAFALRPGQLEGGRAHLDHLVTMRRLAEEWDYGLALDLYGPIDPTWESEAAISKIFPRLDVVRIGPVESTPPGRGRARQTVRALAYLADLGYEGTIAIAAPSGPWLIGRNNGIAAALSRTANYVQARFDAISQDQRTEPIQERHPQR